MLAIVGPDLNRVVAVRRQELATKSSKQFETRRPLIVEHRFCKLIGACIGDRWHFDVDDHWRKLDIVQIEASQAAPDGGRFEVKRVECGCWLRSWRSVGLGKYRHTRRLAD